MRLDGEWLQCLDGDIRPVIRGAMLGGDGNWRTLEFLIDTGADRTVIDAHAFAQSGLPGNESDRSVGGIGGVITTVDIDTQLRFLRDDGKFTHFRGRFVACTQIEFLDMSVLGRDILDMFALVVDRRAVIATILGGNHRYSIHTAP